MKPFVWSCELVSCLFDVIIIIIIIIIIISLFYFLTAKGKKNFFFSPVNGRYLFLNNVLCLFCYLNRFTSTWMSIMMRITSTLIWLRKLSEMKAKALRIACVQTPHSPPPPPHRKNRRRGGCDSPLLIVSVGHVIFQKLWKIIWLAITRGSLHHKWQILIGFRVSRQT